jgi:uncharacterized protein with NAD-binding domain and iron-sulfur cluster
MARERIAVLGGGPASLTAVFHLTSTPELRRKYAITVYQMGWRLGGKGASGRRHGEKKDGDYDQIEEHGLHILFGFYQNFFDMITKAYGELGRAPAAPLATWREAFHPHRYGVVEYDWDKEWAPLGATVPMNRAVPGQGTALNDSTAYLSFFVQGAIEVIFGSKALYRLQDVVFPTSAERWEKSRGCPRQGKPDRLVRVAVTLVTWALEIARDVTLAVEARCARLLEICQWIEDLLWPIWRAISTINRELNLLVLGLDFFKALLRGTIADGVLLAGGYSKIDRWDFAKWLCRHGMHEETIGSPPVRFIYDAAFSYAFGVAGEKEIGAGVAVRTLLRMGLTYKGAAYYKMSSGMGDTVFGPLYEVLKARGVEFAFFHKVERIGLAEQTNEVESIEIDRQVELKNGDPLGYAPFVDVNGLPAWPNEPRWELIEDAERVRGHDLESYYSGWTGTPITLRKGKDFDRVLYGMPVQTVPFVATELMARSWRWKQMVEKVAAVETLSFQIWLKKDLRELGWTLPSPLLSLFVEPLNTWADMSQTLWSESWPEAGALHPKNVSYFTGAQPDGRFLPPLPKDDPEFEKRRYAAAKLGAIQYLRRDLVMLLPGAANPAEPKCLDWSLLVDPFERTGDARFESQYWRSNCGPSERCTLALPDTNQYRIAPGDTGYRNLTITGDWTDNGFYVACMEGTVMSGILAARAIAGVDFDIIGEALDEGLGFEL